jgi:hypothetical protein
MFGAWAIAAGLSISLSAANRDARPRELAFASEDYLTLSIGKFDPKAGWVQATDFYIDTLSSETYTLYGTGGRLREIALSEKRRGFPGMTPADWSAKTSRGPEAVPPFALAIRGSWPDGGGAKDVALEEAEAWRIARDYLRRKGLKVESPIVTQAFQADFLGDGRTQTLVCAHSDPGALKDDQAGDVYAVALLNYGPKGAEKTIALRSQTSHKPASQTLQDHERYYGKRDFLRFIAFDDIDGDGRQEIVLYAAQDDATRIDVFTFDGRRVKKVLSAYKPHYN